MPTRYPHGAEAFVMALASGMRAKICGLNSRKDLNEREVVLEKYVDAKGRWACRTVGVLTEGILVRPDNLVRSPSMLAELPDDELLLVLEQVPIKDLAEHVSTASHKLRAAMQRTWSGPAWCKVRRFFSRTMARAGKQELIRAAVVERDLPTLRTIFREDPAWLKEPIIDVVGSTAATLATSHPDVLRMLLDEFACDVNTRRSDGSTLLIDACNKSECSEDLLACVRILCERGADLYAVGNDGDGALYYAHDSPANNEALSECEQLLRNFGVRGRPNSAVHTSSAGFVGFRDLLPPQVRAELNRGDYTHWSPQWD